MRTSSAKAKGRRLCLKVREMMLEWAPDVRGDEIHVTSSGAGGRDLHITGRAKEVYPFIVEAKNQECNKQMWDWYEQALSHKVEGEQAVPVVIFSKNRAEPMVTLKFEDLLWLMR